MNDQPDYLQLPLGRFLADTAAAQPTPGGGSVAALVGALAAATGQMAANYTLGKKQFANVQDQVSTIAHRLATAQGLLQQLIREDMAAYQALQAATRPQPHETPTNVDRTAALAAAIAVPFEVLTIASAVLADLDQLKAIANPNLLSDVAVAAELAHAAALAAARNVTVNLHHLPNPAEARSLRQQLDHQLTHAAQHHESISRYSNEQL